MKTMTLKITQDLINEAMQKDSAKCMIAQAVRMAGGSSTRVTAEHVAFNIDDVRYTFPMPAKASVELLKFDHSKKDAKPFTITLDGRQGFSRPVIRHPERKGRGPTKAKRKPGFPKIRRSERRYHGLRVLEVQA